VKFARKRALFVRMAEKTNFPGPPPPTSYHYRKSPAPGQSPLRGIRLRGMQVRLLSNNLLPPLHILTATNARIGVAQLSTQKALQMAARDPRFNK
jgi:hypothetical protein